MDNDKKFILVAGLLGVIIVVLLVFVIHTRLNAKDESGTGYFFTKPDSFGDIRSIDISFGINNIAISPVNKKINYFQYDNEGMESPVKELQTPGNSKQQEYIMNKVIPKLKDEHCKDDSTWCVLVTVTGGGAATSGKGNPPDWFNRLLDVYNYDNYFK